MPVGTHSLTPEQACSPTSLAIEHCSRRSSFSANAVAVRVSQFFEECGERASPALGCHAQSEAAGRRFMLDARSHGENHRRTRTRACAASAPPAWRARVGTRVEWRCPQLRRSTERKFPRIRRASRGLGSSRVPPEVQARSHEPSLRCIAARSSIQASSDRCLSIERRQPD
ncbi:hypothetical protein ON010_g1560 [Phytophthora cinnamomi]|nr:hypothetical protein ON010_g1560 [Phytophthora cinnamomi]